MALASDVLRDEAARFRRMQFLIADPQTLKAIEDHARELEQRADWIDRQDTAASKNGGN